MLPRTTVTGKLLRSVKCRIEGGSRPRPSEDSGPATSNQFELKKDPFGHARGFSLFPYSHLFQPSLCFPAYAPRSISSWQYIPAGKYQYGIAHAMGGKQSLCLSRTSGQTRGNPFSFTRATRRLPTPVWPLGRRTRSISNHRTAVLPVSALGTSLLTTMCAR